MTEPDDALLPCPFCGESVTLHEKDSGLLVFLCPEHSPCVGSGLGNFGRAGQRETAIAAWNTRAGHAARDAEVAAKDAENERLREENERLREIVLLYVDPFNVRPEHAPDVERAALGSRT